MLIETFVAGLVSTNGYLVADKPGGQALIIDAPEGVAAAMTAKAREWNTPVRYLITTHAHWDHYWDNAAVMKMTGAKLGIHADSAPLLKIPQTRMWGIPADIEPAEPDFLIKEGQTLEVGDLRFEVLLCPGHCPGNVALYERQAKVVFVGDVLFAGSIGRTDFPGCDHAQLMESIRHNLLPLPDEVKVFSGHGPVTTIGRERRTNPFLAA